MKINQTLLLMMALIGCVLSQKFMRCKSSPDLIVNGGFEQNQCKGVHCWWTKATFNNNFITGWTP